MRGCLIHIRTTDTSFGEPIAVASPSGLLPMITEMVGGDIQVFGWTRILLGGHWVACEAFCDEEGKLNDRPLNTLATTLWHQTLRAEGYEPDDVLVGDVENLTGDDEFMQQA